MSNIEKVTLAKTAGFCYGVSRAVDRVYECAENGERICTFGKLIHNRQVVSELEEKGVYAYDNIDDIPSDTKVIIRTHGAPQRVFDTLMSRGIDFEDLTCPFVEKIHKIVAEHYQNGEKIIIVGDISHPEVIGINGHCENSALVIYDTNTEIPTDFVENPCCVVAQTTINKKKFVQIVNFLKNACKKVLFFDTICNATEKRQEEAANLAAESDAMLVVGGMESSNTCKLYEISKSICPCTFHIETSEDIPSGIYKNKKIGITAGASTPGRIIEEVVKAMDENLKNEESFAEMFEQYGGKSLNNGDIIDGVVVEVRNNEVIVDLGGFKYNGQLALDQLTDDPNAKASDLVKPGDDIKVYVVGVNDSEGKVVLSRKKIVQQEAWNKIKEAYENGDVLEGKIIKAVKGGVITQALDTQVFVPARQASERFVQDLQTLVGNDVKLKLIEIDDRRKRVVGSVRVILEQEKKEKEDAFWSTAEVGKRYTGVVKSLTSFGAFVDIGGVDGLVHISELSWSRIKHPSEVVSVGDTVDVYIKDLKPETKKISLGFKNADDNPWVVAKSKFNVGDVVTVKVVRMLSFGAFAELIPTVDGLIHISQIADRRIEKPEDVLSIGQEVEVKITDIDWDAKKISLSIRALIAPEVKEEEPAPVVEEEPADGEALVYSTDPEVEVEEPIADEDAE